jgi:hypothetical protein
MERLIQVLSESTEELRIFGNETDKRSCVLANDGRHPREARFEEVVYLLKHIVVIGNGK